MRRDDVASMTIRRHFEVMCLLGNGYHSHRKSIQKVNSRYLKVKIHPKLLISQSIFSSSRKFTLSYQKFEVTGAKYK